jgi:hypothetical protein
MDKLTITSSEYEALVKALVGVLAEACQDLGSGEVAGGSTNRIPGKSGFAHQIDVSIDFPDHLLLFECKHWKDPVGAEAILTHSSRLQDIQGAFPGKLVMASVVSTKRGTSGAATLATSLGVNLDVVASFDEFVITLVKRHFAGLLERLQVSDFCDGVVTSKSEA